MIANPFAQPLRELGKHAPPPGICALGDHLLEFESNPAVPAPQQVAGHVVLVASRPRLGKTVFSHRCMHHHHLCGDRQIVDLNTPNSVNDAQDHGPDSCMGRLARQLRILELLNKEQADEISDADLPWSDRISVLGTALWKKDKTSLLIRLPPLDPFVNQASRIAGDIARYAELAEYANSIVLYEYAYDKESEWEEVRGKLAGKPDAQIYQEARFTGLTPLDAWTFIQHRLGEALADRSRFGIDEDWVRDWLGGHVNGAKVAINLPYLNRVFDLAIQLANQSANGHQAPKVTSALVAKAITAMGNEPK